VFFVGTANKVGLLSKKWGPTSDLDAGKKLQSRSVSEQTQFSADRSGTIFLNCEGKGGGAVAGKEARLQTRVGKACKVKGPTRISSNPRT